MDIVSVIVGVIICSSLTASLFLSFLTIRGVIK